ncbi:hypothetical protein, partial [Mycoplasma leonicaptivi]
MKLYNSSEEIFKFLSISFCFAVREFFLIYFSSNFETSIFDNSSIIELNVKLDLFFNKSEQWNLIKLLTMEAMKVIKVLLSKTPS